MWELIAPTPTKEKPKKIVIVAVHKIILILRMCVKLLGYFLFLYYAASPNTNRFFSTSDPHFWQARLCDLRANDCPPGLELPTGAKIGKSYYKYTKKPATLYSSFDPINTLKENNYSYLLTFLFIDPKLYYIRTQNMHTL